MDRGERNETTTNLRAPVSSIDLSTTSPSFGMISRSSASSIFTDDADDADEVGLLLGCVGLVARGDRRHADATRRCPALPRRPAPARARALWCVAMARRKEEIKRLTLFSSINDQVHPGSRHTAGVVGAI